MSNRLRQVVSELRSRILNGEMKAGERITESAAADMLDVSRTPVRLALSILEHEHLVEGETNKGFRVREFTMEDYEESLAVRSTMDGMAARLAAENGLTAEIAAELDHVIDICDSLLEKANFDNDDLQIYARHNVIFHDALARASGNNVLRRQLDLEVPLRFRSALLIFDRDPGKARELVGHAHEDHIGILQAVKSGEGTRSDFLMREHVLDPHRRVKKIAAEMGLIVEPQAEDPLYVSNQTSR